MHDFAHRSIETARVAALLALATAMAAQDAAPVPRFAAVDGIAERAIESKDPVARGEGALWLADSGRHEHYQTILDVAQDSAPAARHRGILAVGRLGAPGCESFLGELVADSAPDAAESALAAFALGQLDDRIPTPAIDGLLRRAHGGSRKRHGALLAALFGGLATRPHPARATAVRDLLDDEGSRADKVTLLAQAALSACAQPATRTRVVDWLADEQPAVRALALESWRTEWRPDAAERDAIRRLARADTDTTVRAAALRLLAQQLDERALDLADRALASHAPAEAGAAAAVLLALAGSARAAAVEDRALDAKLPTEVRIALLDALRPPLSPRALLHCHDTAHDGKAGVPLRVASALALARADSVLAAPALLTVFFASDDAPALTRLAAALRQHADLAAVGARLLKEAAAPDAVIAPRLAGIAHADLALGTDLFLDLAANGCLREHRLGQALAALRSARTRQAPASVLALLPPAVAALEP